MTKNVLIKRSNVMKKNFLISEDIIITCSLQELEQIRILDSSRVIIGKYVIQLYSPFEATDLLMGRSIVDDTAIFCIAKDDKDPKCIVHRASEKELSYSETFGMAIRKDIKAYFQGSFCRNTCFIVEDLEEAYNIAIKDVGTEDMDNLFDYYLNISGYVWWADYTGIDECIALHRLFFDLKRSSNSL